jgi:hypothetical protein
MSSVIFLPPQGEELYGYFYDILSTADVLRNKISRRTELST